ncbi:hypothetical protein HPB48_025699 [Haemaphysalis longicornis]|uniref:Uncharacterized protein n=1 Tax=Haemaphysalis longicornis TaxID=44386 RepID=A0A9J6H9A9_HAELO|nr:hypothetical protein HPB48_025699 [Haemaphysalis longicornis]
MGPGLPFMDGMQLEWQELGELFTRLLRCMSSQDKRPKALSTDVTRPATAQASDLSVADVETPASHSDTTTLSGSSSRRKKPRRAGIARADHLWAVDAEVAAPMYQAIISQSSSSGPKKSRDRKKAKQKDPPQAEKALNAVPDSLVKQGHCDAASLRRRPSATPSTQPPPQGLAREQQQTQKVAMPYSRYQTALPPGEVAVVQGDFKPPVDQRPDRGTLLQPRSGPVATVNDATSQPPTQQPQNRGTAPPSSKPETVVMVMCIAAQFVDRRPRLNKFKLVFFLNNL